MLYLISKSKKSIVFIIAFSILSIFSSKSYAQFTEPDTLKNNKNKVDSISHNKQHPPDTIKDKEQLTDTISAQQNDTIFEIPENAFQSGEELTYAISYGFIKGGKASLSIELMPHGYSYVYHAKAVATTTGMARMLDIYDIYESYFDVTTGLPVMAIRNISEGDYKRYNELRFLHDQGKLISLRSGEHKVPPDTRDILSVFYYARTYLFSNLNDRDSIVLNTFFEDAFWPLTVHFIGYDDVKTDFGKIKCLKFQPIVQAGGMVENEDDIEFWISADKNYVPVKLEVDMPVGKVKLMLTSFLGLKYKLNFVDKKSKAKKRWWQK